jgi:small subunit ribosomal protein S1
VTEEKLNFEENVTEEEAMAEEWPEDRFKELQEGEVIEAKVIMVRDDAAFVDIGGKSDLVIPVVELTAESGVSARSVVKEGDLIRVMVVKAGDEEGVRLSKRMVDQEAVWFEIEAACESGTPVTGTVTEAIKGGLHFMIKNVRAFLPASQAALSFVNDLNSLVGQEFSVLVKEFDLAKRRVVVSRREILATERAEAETEFYATLQEGERRKGKVTRLADFGAFVDLGSGVEGLVHVSEVSWSRIKHPKDLLQQDDDVEVMVTKVDPQARRISLSLRQIQSHPWDESIAKFAEEQVYPGEVVRLESFGAFIRLAPGLDGLVHISQIADRRISRPEEVLKVGDEVQAKVLKIDHAGRKISLSLNAVAQEKESAEVNDFLGKQEQESFGQSLGDFFKKDEKKK